MLRKKQLQLLEQLLTEKTTKKNNNKTSSSKQVVYVRNLNNLKHIKDLIVELR